jgi:hypothetical protein
MAVDETEFHRSVAEIITDLRDAHTRYIGPRCSRGASRVSAYARRTVFD